MSEKDKGNLLSIIDACEKIKRFTSNLKNADDFYEDEKTFDAVLMNFVIIGESISRLSEELKAEKNEISWTKIKGLRNIVAHDYFGVDAEEIWEIINNNIIPLKSEIQSIIE